MKTNQKGFTLIEIVMVLILIGILAAMAAPKYFDLQDQARLRAGQAAVAEAQARVNAIFAQALLKCATCTNAASYAQDSKITTNYTTDYVNNNWMGDWKVSWTSTTSETASPTVKYRTTSSDENGTTVDLSKIQGYTPAIVIPTCAGS